MTRFDGPRIRIRQRADRTQGSRVWGPGNRKNSGPSKQDLAKSKITPSPSQNLVVENIKIESLSKESKITKTFEELLCQLLCKKRILFAKKK